MDATIIAAPSSTKNESGERDPEMHQTKKGNQWHFGMKAHIGVDADSGLVHTVTTTAANEADVEQVGDRRDGRRKRNDQIRALAIKPTYDLIRPSLARRQTLHAPLPTVFFLSG